MPAGVGHDVWVSGNFAPRLTQPASNSDFEIETKFESSVFENPPSFQVIKSGKRDSRLINHSLSIFVE